MRKTTKSLLGHAESKKGTLLLFEAVTLLKKN